MKLLVTAAVAASLIAPTGTASASSCTPARIGGASKCLKAGQFCTSSYQRQYLRYRFSCSSRDANGRYHLRRA